MKKNIFCILVIYMLSMYGYSKPNYLNQKFFFDAEAGDLCISENKIYLETNNFQKEIFGEFIEGKYLNSFKSENENFLVLDYLMDNLQYITLLRKTKNSGKYSSFKIIAYRMVDGKKNTEKLQTFSGRGFNVIKADDYVSEKYDNEKVINFVPNGNFDVTSIPWAVNENSRNKRIYISNETISGDYAKNSTIEAIGFLNGFISPEKDYLYEQNARAKKVLVTYKGNSQEVILSDIGNYQCFKLNKPIKMNKKTEICIEILDYYHGEKYNDIVISGILY